MTIDNEKMRQAIDRLTKAESGVNDFIADIRKLSERIRKIMEDRQ